MTREIKFRGKTAYGCSEWRYGNLTGAPTHPYIQEVNETSKDWYNFPRFEVSPNTIGQYTGLNDKNGNEIYEGDIVKMSTAEYGDEIFRIGYEDSHIGAFCLCSDEQENTSRFVGIFGRNYGYEPFYCEVIGNIYDNPELLKKE